jgi:ferredoxin
MKIAADRDMCIGAGLCVVTAPAVFDQDDDGIVVMETEEPGGSDADAVREAVSLCPSGALSLLDE